MTREEVEKVLESVLDKEDSLLEPPSQSDWEKLSKKFNCKFSNEFIFFIDLMSKYSFPGDIFNVSSGETNGNDSIELIYDLEMKAGNWNSDMIPFYGIGNGDYFCISAKEGEDSAVYYFYHEDSRVEHYMESFSEWLNELPDFLG